MKEQIEYKQCLECIKYYECDETPNNCDPFAISDWDESDSDPVSDIKAAIETTKSQRGYVPPNPIIEKYYKHLSEMYFEYWKKAKIKKEKEAKIKQILIIITLIGLIVGYFIILTTKSAEAGSYKQSIESKYPNVNFKKYHNNPHIKYDYWPYRRRVIKNYYMADTDEIVEELKNIVEEIKKQTQVYKQRSYYYKYRK